jgi:uncharacterized Fe-S cluster protein YjdI/CDGSH-type Zn-finger protein
VDHQPVTRRDYPTAGLTVHWDSDICIHSGVCSRTLPEVFRPREKPWVDPDAAGVAALTAAIDKCPSGALRYTRTALAPEPAAPPPPLGDLLVPTSEPAAPPAPDPSAEPAAAVVITATTDGPYELRGPVSVCAADGTVLREVGRVAYLCRCGHSATKPFCDGTHNRVGFTDGPAPTS